MWDIAGGPAYDIDELYVAANNGDGTFGTPVRVPGINSLRIRKNLKSQTGRGNAQIVAMRGQIESYNVTFTGIHLDQDVLAVLTGSPTYLSGTTPNRVKSQTFHNENMPAFGVVGRSIAGDGGDVQYFLPYCRLMESIEANASYNEFVMPELGGMAIGDPVLLDPKNTSKPLFYALVEHETLTDIAFPPILALPIDTP